MIYNIDKVTPKGASMKKKIAATVIIMILLIGAASLLIDFNIYEKQTKTAQYDREGLIFTLTTFNGDSESEPFVKSLGHAWASVENLSGRTVYLKDYEIKDGETVTFSVWATTGHRGVYFNTEPEFIRLYGRYVGRVSLSVNIDESELNKIADYIDNNDRWELFKNCTYWSVHLWNEVADEECRLKTPALVYTPKRLEKAMGEFDCVETDKDFSGAEGPFWYNGDERTELILCREK